MTALLFDNMYVHISLQRQYGASFPQRWSALFDQSGRGPHQSWRDCGLQDRRQGDPNSTQSTKDPRKVRQETHFPNTNICIFMMSLVVLNCHKEFWVVFLCDVWHVVLIPASLPANTMSSGKMGILSSWPKGTIMQWMTEGCTNRVNTGWRRKMLWDERGGE